MMRNNKDFIIGAMLGIFMVISILFLMGTVNMDASNVSEHLGSNYPSLSLTCSDDGKVIYAADNSRIYASKNFGRDWEIVLTGRNR
jgi:hypothetical protein